MKSLWFCLLVILTSCASMDRETSGHLREMVMANNPGAAIKLLDKSQLASDEKSKLLYFIEKGLLEHYAGDYASSTSFLTEAKSIVEQLYTTRVSGKIVSSITNDNADYYYGEKYEASLVHFYLTLNHYMLAQRELDGQKRAHYLQQARAEVLDWDSFLTDIRNERLGKALFKEDLLAKTFGALVHESQGSNNDYQIALQLYKDASDVFFRNYNLFPSFNESYQSFRENFEKLPTLPVTEVEGTYVRATEHNLAFREFLTMKILLLTQKLYPRDLKAQIAKLKPSADLLQKLSHPHGNITFLVQDGLIVRKVPKTYEFPVNFGYHTSYAAGLGFGNTITFELPGVDPAPNLERARLQAIDHNGKIVSEAPLSVIAPLGELAEQAINEHSAAIAAKTGARIAAKVVAAVVSRYAAEQAAGKKNGGFVALIGTIGYAASMASLYAGEKADLRYWSTLPASIRMGHLTLPAGKYKFRAVFGAPGLPVHRTIPLGEQTITLTDLKFVMDNSHLQPGPARTIAGER